MTDFKKFNLIGGWIVFAIAAFTYISTMEPTSSLWDCGEFIATSYKLEVGHPPGAPLFMMIAKVASLLSFGNLTKVAMTMNLVSALSSAFTILFLFWSISYIARKIILRNSDEKVLSKGQLYAVIGSAAVGALAYTFSDSFWFSAVEAEVYAMSSLFTAVVFWAILKWDEQADEPHSDRWIILIAYLMGLSIGVHLLNLLVIPAIALVYYFRKFKPTIGGSFLVLIGSGVVLLFVMYGVIQGLVGVASGFEKMFVNSFGLPFNSGLLFFLVILIGAIVGLLYWTKKNSKQVIHTSLLAFLVIIIGYSSFAMIMIRSAANPPIDENDPENTFALKSYLNREQYGDRPLISGQYYDADAVDKIDLFTYVRSGEKYIKVKKTNPKYLYDPKRTTIFPRMYSSSPEHIQAYKTWGNVKGSKEPTFANNMVFFMNYQVGFMYFRYFAWNFIGKQNDIQNHGGPLNGNWLSGIPFLDKIVSPQEDIPDKWKNEESRNTYFFLPLILGILGFVFHLSKEKQSFWVVFLLFFMTGIAIVLYLNQTPYQPRERDYAYVGSFYAFSIWIGLAVIAAYDAIKFIKNNATRAIAVTAVMLLVPVLMAFQNWDDHDRSGRYHTLAFASNYLNSCADNAILFTFGDNDTFPLWFAQEVEEVRTDVRDVNLSLFSTDWYTNQMKRKAYDSDPIPVSLDESTYLVGTRDVVFVKDNPNVLFEEKYQANKKELEPFYIDLYNEMMIVVENSSFKTQYPSDYETLSKGSNSLGLQGFIAFVNTLSANAEKLGIDKESIESLKTNVNNFTQKVADSYAPIDAVMKFVISDDPNTKLGYGDEKVDYLPTKKLLIPVDKQKIIDLGFIPKEDEDKIVDNVKFTINKQYLLKAQWLILQMLAENNWERPIYFATSIGNENYMGLTSYFRLEGFAYRLVPIKTPPKEQGVFGDINTDILYDNVMNKFTWGNINEPGYNVDHYVERTIAVMDIRDLFHRLAKALVEEGKEEKALEVLNKVVEVLPDYAIPYDYSMLPIIEDYYLIGEFEKGNQIAYVILDNYAQQLQYFSHFKGEQATFIERDQTIAVYVLQQLYAYATEYEQEELLNKVAPIFQANIDKANFNMQ
ncbi:MAG: DUF2723 domain-containing protein [Bacteroidales bacterium]|nr:DUF2723 domain-containing protein [Bacteroidales bacterium]